MRACGRLPGPTTFSSLTAAAPTTRSDARVPRARASSSARGRGTPRRRTPRPPRPRMTGSCRSTPTSACRRHWPPRSDGPRRTAGDTAGFRLPRVTWHLGRWIRTTDWYPDYQLRLYDRRRARWMPRRVHESVSADGPVATLVHELEHYAYRGHQPSPPDNGSLYVARGRRDVRRRPARRCWPTWRSIRPRRSCATTSCAAGSRTACRASSSPR